MMKYCKEELYDDGRTYNCQALSRLSYTQCEVEVFNLERVGKKMEHKSLVFEMPRENSYGEERREKAAEIAEKECPEGWVAISYFGSQDSFFHKDGKCMARCQILRWV